MFCIIVVYVDWMLLSQWLASRVSPPTECNYKKAVIVIGIYRINGIWQRH